MQQTWAVMAWLETEACLQHNKAELIKEQCGLPHSLDHSALHILTLKVMNSLINHLINND
jgi:hypothetical protein